jgi:hypothetical protein
MGSWPWTTCAFSLAPRLNPSRYLSPASSTPMAGDDLAAVADDAVYVDHQHPQARPAALVGFGKLRRAGFDEAPGHRALCLAPLGALAQAEP